MTVKNQNTSLVVGNVYKVKDLNPFSQFIYYLFPTEGPRPKCKRRVDLPKGILEDVVTILKVHKQASLGLWGHGRVDLFSYVLGRRLEGVKVQPDAEIYILAGEDE